MELASYHTGQEMYLKCAVWCVGVLEPNERIRPARNSYVVLASRACITTAQGMSHPGAVAKRITDDTILE